MKRIVVIGGGHGLALILKGLKQLKDISLSAIVTVADDGGSTGRLRTYYKLPAMGDVRNVLLALANKENLLTRLMDFRFFGESKEDVQGHSLGNLIITALMQEEGSFEKAINILASELEIAAAIIPASLETISLYARMDDDTIVKGEASIPSFNHHIKNVFYNHDVKANERAVKSILEADYVIYGIGSIYTSILPNIIIPSIRDALGKTSAKKIYFANCMTQNNETFDYDLNDHIKALENHGADIDIIIRHQEVIPEDIKERYLKENCIEVIGDSGKKMYFYELLNFEDGLVRHDPNKIALAFKDLMEKEDVL